MAMEKQEMATAEQREIGEILGDTMQELWDVIERSEDSCEATRIVMHGFSSMTAWLLYCEDYTEFLENIIRANKRFARDMELLANREQHATLEKARRLDEPH